MKAIEDDLHAVLNGDTGAFRRIVRACAPEVERLVSAHVLPHEVPETAQAVFVRAYRSLASYQKRGDFSRWLASIALRCCYERLKERYRPEKAFSSLAPRDEDEAEGAGLEESLTALASLQRYNDENEKLQLRERLDSALDCLSPGDRMLLTLTFLEGHSEAEAAELLGMSAVNARVRIHRAKARLRQHLQGGNDEPET